jgi:hypothetical protein
MLTYLIQVEHMPGALVDTGGIIAPDELIALPTAPFGLEPRTEAVLVVAAAHLLFLVGGAWKAAMDRSKAFDIAELQARLRPFLLDFDVAPSPL